MQGPGGHAREDLVRIFRAAVTAVDPALLVKRHLGRDGRWAFVHDDERQLARWTGPILVVGAGKATAQMAAACETVLGPQGVHGLVVVPDGHGVALSSIVAVSAGHPTPDARGMDATMRICDLLRSTSRGPVVALISGGASSLLVRPRPPLTLADKQDTTRRLLASGASIDAVNAVRKHLSLVKGGGMLRATAARPFVSLLLSDVVGDGPDVIGSGPTVPDATRFDDARRVLEEAEIASRVPPSVCEVIERGRRGEIEETLKSDDPAAAGAVSVVIGSNRLAVRGAAAAAKQLGYEVRTTDHSLAGETSDCARRWIAEVLAEVARSPGHPVCMIAGGETTVNVHGAGKGGRNQEFALALVDAVAATTVCVLSAGTDGIDGPTDAAGAFADGTSRARGKALGLDPNRSLVDNDSYGFFSALGDLYRCGPTGTNVMDLKIALSP